MKPIAPQHQTTALIIFAALLLALATTRPSLGEQGPPDLPRSAHAAPEEKMPAAQKPQLPAIEPEDAEVMEPPGDVPESQQLRSGDMLKVSFFETIDVPRDDASADGKVKPEVVRTFFQRIDLTGEYAIDEGGQIAIPLLGRITARGHSTETLRAAVIARFERQMSRPGDVSVVLLKRQPIYILGKVKSEGTIEFVPDMMVLHAVAIAGGVSTPELEASRFADFIRAVADKSRSADKLVRLYARQSALVARRDEKETLEVPEAMLRFAKREHASKALDAAKLRLASEQELNLSERRGLKDRIAQQERLLEGIKSRIADISKELDIRRAKSERLLLLAKRGVTTSTTSDAAHESYVMARDRRDEVKQALVAAEIELARLQTELAVLDAKVAEQNSREIAELDAQIAEAETSMDASSAIVAMASRLYQPADGKDSRVNYTILRKTADGISRISASQTTALVPGDVLNVDFGGTDKSAVLSQDLRKP